MSDHEGHTGSLIRSRGGIALLGFLAIIGFLLTTEHRAHVLGLLPFALLLACPLLHVFHHSGHPGGDQDRPDAAGPASHHKHDAPGGET
jgi:hypothetical protein